VAEKLPGPSVQSDDELIAGWSCGSGMRASTLPRDNGRICHGPPVIPSTAPCEALFVLNAM